MLQHDEAPESPELATGVVPWDTMVAKSWWVAEIVKEPVVGYEDSERPKLMETAASLGRELATNEMAPNRLPSFESGAMTRSILAAGAVACAHSTSIDVLTAPPVFLKFGRPRGEDWLSVKKGRPGSESNEVRSDRMDGVPKASIISMAVPFPL